MIDLDAEFWRAIRFAKASGFDFPVSKHVQWGFARVTFYGDRLYEPQPDGKVMAFIAPVVEGGDLIDLCAIDSSTSRCGQRFGYGKGLGRDAVEKARMRTCNLLLCGNAMSWLRYVGLLHSIPDTRLPAEAIYLFKISDAERELDGVSPIHCETLELSDRLAAVLPPSEGARAMVL